MYATRSGLTRTFSGAIMLVACLVHALPSHLLAQTIVKGLGSVEFRYRGDTIWRERDSTMSRAVYRGDSAFLANFVHGKQTYSATYILAGDFATMIESRNADGSLRSPLPEIRSVPIGLAISNRTMLEQAIQTTEMNERMASMTGSRPEMVAPLSSSEIRNYPQSANTNIVQHGDTVTYVVGCTEAGSVKATVYVLFAGDSLRRLSPDPRTFGPRMVAAVRADMSSIMLRQRVMRTPASGLNLPGPRRWPCDKR